MRIPIKRTENQGARARETGRLAVLALSLLLVSSFLSIGSIRASGYNDVQVFVTTAKDLPYGYTYTAYNSTGSQVEIIESNFSAAAFELPSGQYLFTVSAVYGNGYCNVCLYPFIPANSSGVSSGNATAQFGAVSLASDSTNSTGMLPGNQTGISPGNSTVVPIFRVAQPEAEYGYFVADVSSAQTIMIDTQNVTQFPTYQVSVSVAFDNDTAAVNASVSASVVGQGYFWWYGGNNTVMSAQTDEDGTAVLTLPVAPAVITAWDWVPINVPANQNETVTIGGQKVNVTVTWQPTYVGLSGSTLLVPPSSTAKSASVSITLLYQQPDYWVEPLTASTAPTAASGGTVSNQPSGVPTSVIQVTSQSNQTKYYQPSQIPAFAGVANSKGNGSPTVWITAWILAAGVAAVLVVVGILVLSRRRGPPAPGV